MPKMKDYRSKFKQLFELLDSYLISDLETLIKIREVSGQQSGVGYPTLHTILSSMELMGLILSGQKGSDGFKFYWDKYLCNLFPQYNVSGLSDIFRQVMRNGTSHLYLVKAGVSVSKNANGHLLPRDYQGQQYLNIDLIDLYGHFLSTYNEVKTELLNKPLSPSAQAGWDELERQMEASDTQVQDFLKKNHPSNHPQISFKKGPASYLGTIGQNVGSATTTTSGTVNSNNSIVTSPPYFN